MDKEQLLERYFENKLSQEEALLFQNYLDTDPSFAKEWAFQKNVKKAITLNERADLKQKLQSFETPKSAKKWLSKWSVAASIAVVLGAGYWFMNQSPDTIELYEDYYQSYPNVVAPNVRGENSDNIKSEAFYEYDNGNYEKSLVLFSKIYETDKDDYALFYKALSQMELQKTTEAIATFKQFDLGKNNAFTPFVKWYLALAYLKEKQQDKAIPLLKSLTENENPQEDQAQKLLEDLK
jgi:tetratricopeptide (TPR) repeat protein